MKLSGSKYDAQAVARLSATGPNVTLGLNEIDTVFVPDFEEQAPETKFPVFFKLEGKYVVLLGHAGLIHQLESGKTEIRGKLISTPVLKKCRLESAQQRNQPLPLRKEWQRSDSLEAERSNEHPANRGTRGEPHSRLTPRNYNGPRGPRP